MNKPISEVTNEDCMEMMKRFPDKYFDLAIVDPPYGVGQHFNFRYGIGDAVYDNISPPPQEYFNELFRISKNQIIWGGNYFTDKLPVNRCWIAWIKENPLEAFSDFELAWTSFNKVSRSIKLRSYGFHHADGKTIHPTQKPIKLYDLLLKRYAKPYDKILDTHLGSGSSRISAYKNGFDFWACEIDNDYFEDSKTRFNEYFKFKIKNDNNFF